MGNRWYLYVKAFSDMGAMMDMVVLTAIVYAATHSGAWMSAALCVRTVGGLLSSLASGVMADRMDRRKLMIVSDVVRAVCVGVLIFLPSPYIILAASFVVGFFGSYFAVSFSADVPRMFGEDAVLETNSVISRLSAISMVFGFLGAGVLQSVGGYSLVLGLDAFSYLLSAAVLMRMRWDSGRPLASAPVPSAEASSAPGKASVFGTLRSDLSEVGRYLKAAPLLCVIFVGYLVETFGASSHNVGIPLLAATVNSHQQTLWYGLIWGVWAVGNVAATMVLPHLEWVKRRLYLSYWLSTMAMSCGFICLLSGTHPSTIFPFAFLTGIFDAMSGTLYSTIMQMSDNRVRGRVFGVSTLVNRLGFGAGFVAVPLLLQRFTMPHMVWLMHGLVITCTVISMVYGLRLLPPKLSTRAAEAAR